MVTKPVHLSNGMSFEKAGDAEAFFRAILNSGEMLTPISSEQREALNQLFNDYCSATEWQMPAAPQEYFRDWNRAKERSTKSFFVRYDNGFVDDFSYIKAVRAVANWKR